MSTLKKRAVVTGCAATICARSYVDGISEGKILSRSKSTPAKYKTIRLCMSAGLIVMKMLGKP